MSELDDVLKEHSEAATAAERQRDADRAEGEKLVDDVRDKQGGHSGQTAQDRADDAERERLARLGVRFK